jgi:ankyrin repeat protein
MPTCVCVWQYPGEDETVWNACSFLQLLPGREEVVLPPGGGMVRIFHVLVSANSRAETVEELEGRRKRVVVQVLDTLHADVCRAVDAAVKTAEFEKRLAQDKDRWAKSNFIKSIKDESTARVAVYKAMPDGAYAAIEVLGGAVSKCLALPLLANAKLRLWLEDPSLDLSSMTHSIQNDYSSSPFYFGFNRAQGRRLANRRLLLQDSSAAGRLDGVGRIVVEDGLGRMGGKATAELALEDCRERRLITGAGAAALESKDPYTQETPLITQLQLGEYENAQRLLQAGADLNATTADGERVLLIGAKEGREDLVQLLVDFKADLNARDAKGETVLDTMSKTGNVAGVQALLKAGADIKAQDRYGMTALMMACRDSSENRAGQTVLLMSAHKKEAAAALLVEATKKAGALDLQSGEGEYGFTGGRSALHWASSSGMDTIVSKLLSLGADVALKDKKGMTSLMVACASAKEEAAALLLEATKKAGALDLQDTIDKRSALHYASRSRGVESIVAKLLSLGADAALVDADGRTALMLACREEPHAVTKHRMETVMETLRAKEAKEAAAALLLEATKKAGALFLQCGYGRSAMHWASSSGMDTIVSKLLSLDADVALKDKDGMTSLMVACERAANTCGPCLSVPAVVQTLLQHGADVAATNNVGAAGVLLALAWRCAHECLHSMCVRAKVCMEMCARNRACLCCCAEAAAIYA